MRQLCNKLNCQQFDTLHVVFCQFCKYIAQIFAHFLTSDDLPEQDEINKIHYLIVY